MQVYSHREIAENFRSNNSLQRELDLQFISLSQLSRRLIELNTEHLVNLLDQLTKRYWNLQRYAVGINTTCFNRSLKKSKGLQKLP